MYQCLKKNLKQTHNDWEYRSAVEYSKISFVPTSSCQEIYTENTCFSVKSRHNYLSILSKSIQHKIRKTTSSVNDIAPKDWQEIYPHKTNKNVTRRGKSTRKQSKGNPGWCDWSLTRVLEWYANTGPFSLLPKNMH